tara:strand:- start:445 stop:705 length:261 start_codon:yes stop_codon:yes gene_type:complete
MKTIKEFQQEEIEDQTLLLSFDDELCELMQKYIDVNHKHRAKELFFDDKDIVEDFNYALNILQRLIKETYKQGVIKENTLLEFKIK